MTQAIDWDRLVRLRDRKQRVAMEAMAVDRRRAEAAAHQCAQAARQRDQQVQASMQHVIELCSAFHGGCCDVAQLRHAGAFTGVLEARIKNAALALQQAQQQHAGACEVLRASQQRLRGATAELRAAQEMGSRAVAARARLRDQRADDAADESARQIWLGQHARRAKELA